MDDETIATELNRRADQMEAEAKRLRIAANILNGKRLVAKQLADPAVSSATVSASGVVRSGTNHSRAASTIPMIRRTLAKYGPLDYADLTETMLSNGWQTESQLPKNTVRTALSRLHERGTVVRRQDGRYELLESDSNASASER